MELNPDDFVERLKGKHLDFDLDQSQFSEPAFETLNEKTKEYINDLIVASVKLARRNKLDSVSAIHVERASERLVGDSRHRFSSLLTVIGGILLGASSSGLISMTITGQVAVLDTLSLVYAAFAILGSTLLGLSVKKRSPDPRPPVDD